MAKKTNSGFDETMKVLSANLPMIDSRANRQDDKTDHAFKEPRTPVIRCSQNFSNADTLTHIPENVLNIM